MGEKQQGLTSGYLIVTFILAILAFLQSIARIADLYGRLEFVLKVLPVWSQRMIPYTNTILLFVALVVIWGWWQARSGEIRALSGLRQKLHWASQEHRGSLALMVGLVLMVVVLLVVRLWTRVPAPSSPPNQTTTETAKPNTEKSVTREDSGKARTPGIVQRSTGPNSPNIVGNNNDVTDGSGEPPTQTH